MRLLTTLTLLLISSLSYGQGIWNQVNGNSKFWRLKADSVLIVPRDTLPTNNALYLGAPVGDSGRIAYEQKALWVHNDTGWARISYAGEIPIGVLDSARRSNDTLYFRTSSGSEIAVKMEGIEIPGVVGLQDSLSARVTLNQLNDSLATTNQLIQNRTGSGQNAAIWITQSARASAFRTLQNSGISSYQLATTGDNIRWGIGFVGPDMDYRVWSYTTGGMLIDSAHGINRLTSAAFFNGRLSVGTTIDDGVNRLQVNGTISASAPAYSAGGIGLIGRNNASGRIETGTLSNFGITLQNVALSGGTTSRILQFTGTSGTPSTGAGLEIAGSNTAGFVYAQNRTGGGAMPLKLSHTGGDVHMVEVGGSVGIGNTSPGARLDINGTSSSTGSALRVRNSTPAAVFQVDNNGDVTIFGGVKLLTGSSNPEGAVTAPAGSLYLRSTGGAGTTFYVKESGSGNTGWIGK